MRETHTISNIPLTTLVKPQQQIVRELPCVVDPLFNMFNNVKALAGQMYYYTQYRNCTFLQHLAYVHICYTFTMYLQLCSPPPNQLRIDAPDDNYQFMLKIEH